MVLKAIYEQGIKLPDSARELISETNCKTDFIYKKARIAIFCDGSIHDSPEQQQRDHEVPRQSRDRLKRENLHDCGYEFIELNYRQNWRVQLEQLRSLL